MVNCKTTGYSRTRYYTCEAAKETVGPFLFDRIAWCGWATSGK